MNVTIVTRRQGEVPTKIEIGQNLTGLRICAMEFESLQELMKLLNGDNKTREWFARNIYVAWVPSTYKKGDRDGIRIL